MREKRGSGQRVCTEWHRMVMQWSTRGMNNNSTGGNGPLCSQTHKLTWGFSLKRKKINNYLDFIVGQKGR